MTWVQSAEAGATGARLSMGAGLEGADEHITQLSQKYRGEDFHTPTDRVIVKVKPERIFDYQVS